MYVGEDGFLLYLVARVTFAIRKLKQRFPALFSVCVRERSARTHSDGGCASGGGYRPVAAIVTTEGYLW